MSREYTGTFYKAPLHLLQYLYAPVYSNIQDFRLEDHRARLASYFLPKENILALDSLDDLR